MDGNVSRLMSLARQYGAESALVTLAVIDLDESLPSGPSLTVTTRRYGPQGQTAPLRETFEAMPGESVDDLLDRAAATIHADLQARWRQEAVAATMEPAVIGVAVPITRLSDWLSIRSRLQNQRLVKEIDLVALTREEARVNLHYVGEVSELTKALQQDGLELVRNGERWTLMPPDGGRQD
jgi:hypothetical protein